MYPSRPFYRVKQLGLLHWMVQWVGGNISPCGQYMAVTADPSKYLKPISKGHNSMENGDY